MGERDPGRRVERVRRARAGAGEADRVVGQRLLQIGRRCAVRGDQEIRAAHRREDRAVAVPGAGHDPEDGGRARCRHRARRGLRRRLRLPGHRQVGLRRQARRPVRHHRAAEGKVPAEHGGDDLPLQRQDQEARVLRLPAEAADHAHPVLVRHAAGCRLHREADPDRVEGLLEVLVREGAARLPQEDRHARVRHRPADGRGLERLVLLVPHLHGRVQRQAGRQ